MILYGRLSDWSEVRVGHGFFGSEAFLKSKSANAAGEKRETYHMVVSQKLVQEVNGIIAHKTLVFGVDEAMPTLLRKAAENVVILRVELDIISVQVVKEIFCAQHFCNLDELVRVAVAMEEGLFAEYHGCEHGTQRPHVE